MTLYAFRRRVLHRGIMEEPDPIRTEWDGHNVLEL